ncbi:MAG: hypothetical protein RSE16_08050 [Sphingobium sp.]|nr:MAG: hypothetical protein RSE16_08050 [Sphingobium sp.]
MVKPLLQRGGRGDNREPIMPFARHLSALLFALLLAFLPAHAHAQVVATFYSHDFGDHFPHAFIKLKGKIESSGEVVDTNYGFTAVTVSPAILMGSVKGMIETKDAKYVGKSNAHFSLQLSDDEYRKLIDHVEKWRNMGGKSYNLNKRNCVHFVMEAAALLGLSVNRNSKFFKKPKSFLFEVMRLNPRLKL